MTFYSSRLASAALLGLALSTTAYVSVAQVQEATATGEVRRIDVSAQKITLKHGSIDALQLPAMTLVYKIDPALLGDIKPGDKVRFTAKRENEQYVVTKIQK
ncbi:copper-binding protein [Paenalcaligenes niemegkensis]|uniref:copper-binding protein n=1 Tax=Paenalcaligenes niemegkensis TaxID=2895469 RepID=UPI001EE915BC|nr:copper-binding protein [Paenalcaligenes niemegkensis]MCQ9617490.1 copper-binding protein [Paenalcaligenes niemegkensis]